MRIVFIGAIIIFNSDSPLSHCRCIEDSTTKNRYTAGAHYRVAFRIGIFNGAKRNKRGTIRRLTTCESFPLHPYPSPSARLERRRVSTDRVPRHLDVRVLLSLVEYINIVRIIGDVRHPVNNGRGLIVPSFVIVE